MRQNVPDRGNRYGPGGERAKADIIAAATNEFARRGMLAGRIDTIADHTRCSRALIYYYFGSKEGLYLAVLEAAFHDMQEALKKVDLADVAPKQAIRRLVAFMFDYCESKPTFVALLTADNQCDGKFICKTRNAERLKVAIHDTITAVLHVGAKHGVFRRDVDVVDVTTIIAGLGWFQAANQHAFDHLISRNGASKKRADAAKELMIQTVLRYLANNSVKKAQSGKPRAEKFRAGVVDRTATRAVRSKRSAML